ncbi:MAG TPA: patatin-like phospholipase family protein [Solirubrobacteraceae bacterium]|nr:patatin-like phospholipase family protein [Solirubrobacteraceae bacterium]
MPEPLTTRPDAVVLGAGGTLGIWWLRGVLAGLEEAGIDARGCEYFVGTSAGSVVAAQLAAGMSQREGRPPPALAADTPGPVAAGRLTELAGRLTAVATAPLGPAALAVRRRAAAPLGAAALLPTPRSRPVPEALRRHVESLGVDFDGRLRIAAVDRRSGRRVVFGEPGAPPAGVADAVMASCSIPWVFAPVRIAGREYVDGGVWSTSNADAVPAGRGAEIACLLPLLSPRGGGAPARALRAAAQAMAFPELAALRARGARVRVVAPDAEAARAIGPNPMAGGRQREVYAAGWAQGRALAGG